MGRKEISIAETGNAGPDGAARGIRRSAAFGWRAHRRQPALTIQTAVLIETLWNWAPRSAGPPAHILDPGSCGRRHCGTGYSRVRLQGREPRGILGFQPPHHGVGRWRYAEPILDDGGDATMLVNLGTRAEQDCSVLDNPTCEEEEVLFAAIRARLDEEPGWYSRVLKNLQGVTEETTTGVHRLYQLEKRGELNFPGYKRQRLGNQIQVRQPLRLPRITGGRNQAGHGRNGSRQDRPGVWLRRRRQRVARSHCAVSAQRSGVTEIDPICALQAAMEGYRVVTVDDACSLADIIVTATGNVNVIDHDHMSTMKDQAILCNIGHLIPRSTSPRCASTSGRTSSLRWTT